jgi:hypothetical protein
MTTTKIRCRCPFYAFLIDEQVVVLTFVKPLRADHTFPALIVQIMLKSQSSRYVEVQVSHIVVLGNSRQALAHQAIHVVVSYCTHGKRMPTATFVFLLHQGRENRCIDS